MRWFAPLLTLLIAFSAFAADDMHANAKAEGAIKMASVTDGSVDNSPIPPPVLSPDSPEVQEIIQDEVEKFEQQINEEQNGGEDVEDRVVVITQEHEMAAPISFGFTVNEILESDAHAKTANCSSKYLYGDLTKKNCQKFFSKIGTNYIRSKGVSKELSALLSATLFMPRDFLLDRAPSFSSLVMGEYDLFNARTQYFKNTRMTVTLFGDKALYLTLKKNFK